MDEYAQVLAEAIESRTNITELWKVLETTEIGVEGFREDEAEPSPFGDAANFPKQLFDEFFRNLYEGELNFQ